MNEILARRFDKGYDVHVYVRVRVKVAVEAGSQIDGIKRAVKQVDWYRLFDREFGGSHPDGIIHTECADGELLFYLVDEHGDEQYENSRWYHDDEKVDRISEGAGGP